MSKVIDKFESRKGRPPIYPWEKWTDSKSRVLRRGTEEAVADGQADFAASLVSFRTMIHRKARDLGANVGAFTSIDEKEQAIKVRFYKRNEE